MATKEIREALATLEMLYEERDEHLTQFNLPDVIAKLKTLKAVCKESEKLLLQLDTALANASTAIGNSDPFASARLDEAMTGVNKLADLWLADEETYE